MRSRRPRRGGGAHGRPSSSAPAPSGRHPEHSPTHTRPAAPASSLDPGQRGGGPFQNQAELRSPHCPPRSLPVRKPSGAPGASAFVSEKSVHSAPAWMLGQLSGWQACAFRGVLATGSPGVWVRDSVLLIQEALNYSFRAAWADRVTLR